MSNGNLPTTRFALFKDILRYRFFDLVFTSLYIICFFLPALFWIVFVNFSFLNTFDNIYNPLVVYSVLAVLIGLVGPGFAGAFYFIKKLVYSEGANVHKDFFVGVKDNYKMFFWGFFLLGLAYGIIHFAEAIFYLDQSINKEVRIVLLVVMYVAFVLFIIATLFMSAQAVIYEGRYLQLITNGMKFVVGDFLRALLFGLIIIVPFLLYEFVPLVIVEWTLVGVSALFYFGFGTLVFTLYAHTLFDQTINKENFPQLIRKGLGK